MNELEEIAKNLIEGREGKVEELIHLALAEGIGVAEILNNGLIAGMNVVGERFKQAEMFIPEVLLAAKAMNAGINILSEYIETVTHL